MLEYLPHLFSAFALVLSAYLALRAESREDGQTPSQRLRKIEVAAATLAARQQGFQTEIEQVADFAKRERDVLKAECKRDIDALKEQIKDVPTMRELLYRMVERLENTGKAVEKLDGKMDRIVELLTHK